VTLWLVGLILAAVGLWILLAVPILYSAGRALAPARLSCRCCGAASLVPLDSPIARKMRKDLTPPA
jgi:hypothetical protein